MTDELQSTPSLTSFPSHGLAIVIGATGGIGASVLAGIRESGRFADVIGLSRSSDPSFDLTSESSIANAAKHIAAHDQSPRLIFVATGLLHDEGMQPEKSLARLDPDNLARAFAINAIGPALVMKHFLPLLPVEGKSVFACLSARVGSIGDNALGGWHGYRASKAALNQLIRTASIELKRRKPSAICVALHPGTVATNLTAPFAKTGLDVQTPTESAARLLHVVDRLTPEQSGCFFDHRGQPVPW
jgi:NAD(P)-dependent dehydrogenase (short-subunit alcohol dehydrogenase family)